MWVYLNGSGAAYNLDHVTRLFVEETGSGAALKAELAGKTLMIGYYSSKSEAQAALNDILLKQEANAPEIRL